MEQGQAHIELIKKCQKNDQNAQLTVYKLYYKAMFNTANRILNNNGDAEDAMQEGFLAAFTSVRKFDFNVSFGTWLKRIIINKSLDIYRKRSKIVFSSEVESIAETINFDFSDNNDNQSDHASLIKEINDAIYDLPDGYRIVFSLYLLEGYDHEEIASILGINASTSRSQLAKARKILAEKFKEKNKFKSTINYG